MMCVRCEYDGERRMTYVVAVIDGVSRHLGEKESNDIGVTTCSSHVQNRIPILHMSTRA